MSTPTLRDLAAWWLTVVRFTIAEIWASLPGPWWCKLIILIVCAAIPGSFDEIAVIAVCAAWRRRQARKLASA